jgi:hypothetical protein
MDTQTYEGKEVTLISYGGKLINRVVVKDLGSVLLVCKTCELEQARTEKRDPICIGFKKEYIR